MFGGVLIEAHRLGALLLQGFVLGHLLHVFFVRHARRHRVLRTGATGSHEHERKHERELFHTTQCDRYKGLVAMRPPVWSFG